MENRPLFPEEQVARSLQLTDTLGLILLAELYGDELLRRAIDEADPRCKRELHLATVKLVEARAHLRMILAHELGVAPPAVIDPAGWAHVRFVPDLAPDQSPAVPVSDPQHGAAKPEAPPCTGVPTTTGSAGGFSEPGLFSLGRGRFECPGCGRTWMNPMGQLCGGCDTALVPAPTSPSPRSSIAAAVAARAEGADGEGGAEGDARAQSSSDDRGELGKDLSRHLAVLKGGAA